MAAPKPRSSRSSDNRLSVPDKMEVTESWDALEWTKIEPVSRSVSYGMSKFLLEGEEVIVEGSGIVLVNIDEAGTLLVTNFRILFVVMKLPPAPRQSDKTPSQRLLQVIGKDMRIIVFGFRPRTKQVGPKELCNSACFPNAEGKGAPIYEWIKDVGELVLDEAWGTSSSQVSPEITVNVGKLMATQPQAATGDEERYAITKAVDLKIDETRRAVFEALWRCTRPARLWDLYTFTCGPSKFNNTNPKLRLLNEYFRLLGKGSYHASSDAIEDGSFSVSNEWWRISGVNSSYTMCPTYPFSLIVPKCIRNKLFTWDLTTLMNLYCLADTSDEEVLQASTFRARCRLPVISWCHPGTGAVLARSSQPLVGLMMNTRSNADEKLVAALCTQNVVARGPRRKLYIADARPRKNALANGAMGGGSESSSNYFQSEIVFFGIDNIHAMRDSFARLRDYLDTYGATSSDGMSSFLVSYCKSFKISLVLFLFVADIIMKMTLVSGCFDNFGKAASIDFNCFYPFNWQRHGGWSWGGGNLSSMSASVSTLGDTGWLLHVQSVLAGSAWIAARVHLESSSVLVHCRLGVFCAAELLSVSVQTYYVPLYPDNTAGGTYAFDHADSTSVLLASKSPSWVIDSGASAHITGKSSLFSSITKSINIPSVALADGSTSIVVDDGHALDSNIFSHFVEFDIPSFIPLLVGSFPTSPQTCPKPLQVYKRRTQASEVALVEKDWLAFGHPFSDRMGMPTISGNGNAPLEISRQSSGGNIPSSPMRHTSGSSPASSSSHAQTSNNYSPIFLQWVDCVSQLLRMYPFAFEFSSVCILLPSMKLVFASVIQLSIVSLVHLENHLLSLLYNLVIQAFLVDFLDCMLSCRFGNFLCNSDKERQQSGVSDACGCLWMYLADLRASEGSSHGHFNLFYDPLKHEDPLLPPAAALAPTLWPQFHLRWACPSEAQAGELEAQYWMMAKNFSEMQKAKEVAERNAKDVMTRMESLTTELRNEKHLSSSAMDLAKRACKESAAIKRAIQSLGCKVHFSNSGDCALDMGSTPPEIQQKFTYSPSKREPDGNLQREEKSELSVSLSVMTDDAVPNNPLSRVCESLCPLRTREGGCKWPDAGCAQLGSQFVGLKANFDAFDRLSIYDGYFGSK
ncbi:hypothetical protein HHK36_016755 [Tetracentron sinense]|uniref:Myotubularin phosphatase domain-containing protein n=1 Tax=Tetracentron sinense TaxID=13715 RepID=A0A834Z1W4_TETSI|nr:hypothetical protein HHK36_016755 [Tetracentron sinense]